MHLDKSRTRLFRGFINFTAILAFLLFLCVSSTAHGQSLASFDRDNARTMLSILKDDIKNTYYDKDFRGVNLDQRFKDAEYLLKEAQTRDQLMAIVAQAMMDFNDSHTFFIPPPRAASVEYGWQMQMIGDYGFITHVKPGSDAEKKGLRRGDVILSIDGFRPDRPSMWKMLYRYYAIMPARSVSLLVQSPGESKPKQLDVASTIKAGKSVVEYRDLFIRYLSSEGDLDHDRFFEVQDALMIWSMPTFTVSSDHIDGIMSRARKFKTLVLDLRNNGGGYVSTLERLTGYFYDHDVKIGDLRGRKEMKPMVAKTRADNRFTGNLIVLVDSGSASASELFARTCQIEKRCTVLGDQSAGAVMRAKGFYHESGVGRVLYFGGSVTDADIIMTDGKSLENLGVIPDQVLKPTGKEIATNQDPVLSLAAKLAGVELDAGKAGTLFPFEWPKN